MKKTLIPATLVLAAGVSLTAMGAASPLTAVSAEQVAEIKSALNSAKLVEAPYKAAHLVMASKKAERSAVVRLVVATVLEKHPTTTSATVRAVLTVAPDEVQAVMEAVMEKVPQAYESALAAVGQINPSQVTLAAGIVGQANPSARSNAMTIAEAFTAAAVANNPEYAPIVKRGGATRPTVKVSNVITVLKTGQQVVVKQNQNSCLKT